MQDKFTVFSHDRETNLTNKQKFGEKGSKIQQMQNYTLKAEEPSPTTKKSRF
jgi:hypothetical protein